MGLFEILTSPNYVQCDADTVRTWILQFIKDIKNNPNNVDDTDEQIKGVLYGKLRFWVLEWWRTEGILEKK